MFGGAEEEEKLLLLFVIVVELVKVALVFDAFAIVLVLVGVEEL